MTQALADAQGGDPKGIRAFTVGRSTAAAWVCEARDSALPDAAAVLDVQQRLWQIQLQSLDELERLQRKLDRDYDEQRSLHLEVLAAVKRQREIEKLLGSRRVPPDADDDAGAARSEPSLVERLARAAAADPGARPRF